MTSLWFTALESTNMSSWDVSSPTTCPKQNLQEDDFGNHTDDFKRLQMLAGHTPIIVFLVQFWFVLLKWPSHHTRMACVHKQSMPLSLRPVHKYSVVCVVSLQTNTVSIPAISYLDCQNVCLWVSIPTSTIAWSQETVSQSLGTEVS